MSLKEIMAEDVRNVFFSQDDFGETHTINNITCSCVLDDDRLIERTDAAAIGTHLGERLLFVASSLLPGKPAVGNPLTLDGKKWIVRGVADNAGVYEIRLGANKT